MQVSVLCEFSLKMPIPAPFGVKMGKTVASYSFIPLGMQQSGLTCYESNSVKIASAVQSRHPIKN